MPMETFRGIYSLPDPIVNGDHYLPFSELYGVPTTEKDRPSLCFKETIGHGVTFSPNNQTAKNVSKVMCSECLRPRLLYAKHKLSWPEEEVLYSCGASLKEIIPEGVDPKGGV